MAILRLLRGAAADFRDHGCASLAASLAFFSLLSFFPVIFVVLYAMSAVLRQHDLGLILDFVPNHVGVHFADNPWWLDVLEWGPASPHAASDRITYWHSSK